MKRVFCIALSMILIVTLAVPAFAESPSREDIIASLQDTLQNNYPDQECTVQDLGRLVSINVTGPDALAAAAMAIYFGDGGANSWAAALDEVGKAQQAYQAMFEGLEDPPLVLFNYYDKETGLPVFMMCEGAPVFEISQTTLTDEVGGTADPTEQAAEEAAADPELGEIVLVDQDGVRVYWTGRYKVEGAGDSAWLYLETVVVNETGTPIGVRMEPATVNGWDVYTSGVTDVSAKKKSSLDFALYDAGIEKYEEVESVVASFVVYDCTNYSTLFTTDPVTIPLA